MVGFTSARLVRCLRRRATPRTSSAVSGRATGRHGRLNLPSNCAASPRSCPQSQCRLPGYEIRQLNGSLGSITVIHCWSTSGRGRVKTARGSEGEWLAAQWCLESAGEVVCDAGARSRPMSRLRSGWRKWAGLGREERLSPSMRVLRSAFRRCPGCASRASGCRPERADSSRCARTVASSSGSGSTPSST